MKMTEKILAKTSLRVHDATVVLDVGEASLFGENFEGVDVPIASELPSRCSRRCGRRRR